jgi:uncharacterized protein
MLPMFRAGDIPGGVVSGTDALIEQLSLDPSTAEQRVAAASAASAQTPSAERAPSPMTIIFVILFVIFILRGMFRGGMGGLWLAPLIFSSGGRRWDGGGDGGGFGGGFSGGGGSFGGGGSSGSW